MSHLPIDMGEDVEDRRAAYYQREFQARIAARLGYTAELRKEAHKLDGAALMTVHQYCLEVGLYGLNEEQFKLWLQGKRRNAGRGSMFAEDTMTKVGTGARALYTRARLDAIRQKFASREQGVTP